MSTTYASRSTRRTRRSRADIEAIEQAIIDVLAADSPVTVRQLFYQLTSRGGIAKTEAEYKSTVVRLLSRMRRRGQIPFYEAAEAIADQDRPTYLYYLGDHDPSGLDIDRSLQANLRQFAPHAEIIFQRVAVTPAQIQEMNLPARPTKRTDSRSRGFRGDSVEVDAIPAHVLREIVRGCIEQHIDRNVLDRTKHIEQQERESLDAVPRIIRGGAA